MIVRILHQAALDDLQCVGDVAVGLIVACSGNDDVDGGLASIIVKNREQAAGDRVSGFEIEGFFDDRLGSMPIDRHEIASIAKLIR